jgi:nicotinate-nucleotide--dimethylbenzimidazole phosphoribosyltransferase
MLASCLCIGDTAHLIKHGVKMFPFIQLLDYQSALAVNVQHALDNKTKPPGSLGRLEALALQLALVQNTPQPKINTVHARVFAADHGVVAENVSAYPQAVTAQMVLNFLAGGAAINVLARQCGAELKVVNAGVASEFPVHKDLIDACIAQGTQNFLLQAAMSPEQCERALQHGINISNEFTAQSIVVFGEMGIGNTTSAAAILHALTRWPAEQCVGAGTGSDSKGIAHKADVIARSVKRAGENLDAMSILCEVGGFEIAMMCGAMLGAAAKRCTVLVDGFIATAAAAIVIQLVPAVRDYLIFAHVSAEAPHARWLQQLQVQPLLQLGMRLGEGTGAMMAVPVLQAACALLNEMATFESAGVSNREA